MHLTHALLASALLAAAPSTSAGSSQEPVEIEITHSGSLWKKGKYQVRGGFRIEQRGEKRALLLDDDFVTKEGPDLKLVLSPRAHDQVTAKNALDVGVIVGELASERGAGRYVLPDDLDLSRFRSLAIYCEKYTVLWAAAPLGAGELLAHGQAWTEKSEEVEGHWEIARVGEALVVRLGSDFDTKSGPDLKLVLSPHTPDAAKSKNALEGGVVIAPLRSDEGAQEFRYEGEVDLAEFRSLLIHCERYTKLWGAAALR